MEELWRQSVRDAPREEVERRAGIEEQVYKEIRRARRGHGHMTAVTLWVQVAKCMGCIHSEARALEQQLSAPTVYGRDWSQDYAALGFPPREIRAVRQALEGGSWHPRCYWCGSTIDVLGEGFCVKRTDISEYFGLKVHDGRTPPKWMKDAVLRGFGSRCASCKTRLTLDKARFDHIVPVSKDGATEMTNLQVLCEPCNTGKANQEVESVDVILMFPLCPPPSDAFEGVIW